MPHINTTDGKVVLFNLRCNSDNFKETILLPVALSCNIDTRKKGIFVKAGITCGSMFTAL